MIKELTLISFALILLTRTSGYEIATGDYVISRISARRNNNKLRLNYGGRSGSLTPRKYFAVLENRKFEDAEEQCEKSHGEGWGLATITTPEEFRELDSYMTANKFWFPYWIGGSFVPGTEWEWSRLKDKNSTGNLRFKPFLTSLFKQTFQRPNLNSRALYAASRLIFQSKDERNNYLCEDLSAKLPPPSTDPIDTTTEYQLELSTLDY